MRQAVSDASDPSVRNLTWSHPKWRTTGWLTAGIGEPTKQRARKAELREWNRAAEAIRPTCLNPSISMR